MTPAHTPSYAATATDAQDAIDHAVKGGGERQASPTLEGIRADHLVRYQFAAKQIAPGARIVDAACGVGYGSNLLAESVEGARVDAFDLSADAIGYARAHYAHPSVTYHCRDCTQTGLEAGLVDAVVSLETVEHIEDAAGLLAEFRRILKPGGMLIASTPNQEQLPFTPEAFPFHVRHYLPSELTGLVASAGFAIAKVISNTHRKKPHVADGWDGLYNIVVCRLDKPQSGV